MEKKDNKCIVEDVIEEVFALQDAVYKLTGHSRSTIEFTKKKVFLVKACLIRSRPSLKRKRRAQSDVVVVLASGVNACSLILFSSIPLFLLFHLSLRFPFMFHLPHHLLHFYITKSRRVY